MDEKEIIEMIYDLENESYCLMKSIDVLRKKVLPDDADVENDYTRALLALLGHQSELIYRMLQNINMYI